MYYERMKHDGTLPLIGVNTFLPEEGGGEQTDAIELMRSTDVEKDEQIASVRAFQALGADRREAVLAHLREVARDRGNVFAALNGRGEGGLARPDLGRSLRGRRRVPAHM